jgi:hypothetical protein
MLPPGRTQVPWEVIAPDEDKDLELSFSIKNVMKNIE